MWEDYIMTNRLDLHKKLLQFYTNIYFQPPENIVIKYPCIIYQRVVDETWHADGLAYIIKKRYDITIIEKDPDSDVADRMVQQLPYSKVTQRYITDNLYHTKIELYD